VQNVIAVLITFAFVFALGTTALFVVNRWERQHQSESQTPVDGFRIRRWRHRRRQVRIARRPVGHLILTPAKRPMAWVTSYS
jgi:hypothetical protein